MHTPKMKNNHYQKECTHLGFVKNKILDYEEVARIFGGMEFWVVEEDLCQDGEFGWE